MTDRLQEPRASLDHFNGREVKSVDGEGSDWSITLDGGVVISNKDETRTEIPDVKGKTLLFVALGELETRLQFGNSTPGGVHDEVWVTLSPTKYTIGGLEGQTKEFYPQVPEELESMLPPDPSPERVVDGPTEETQEAQGGDDG